MNALGRSQNGDARLPGWGMAVVMFFALLLVAALVVPGQAIAQDDAVDLAELTRQLNRIEQGLVDRSHLKDERLAAWSDAAEQAKRKANECVARAEEELASVEADLAELGEAGPNESATARKTRRTLERQKSTAQQRLSTCKALILHSEEVKTQLTQRATRQVAERFTARGPTFFKAFSTLVAQPGHWASPVAAAVEEHSGLRLLSVQRVIVLGLLVIAGLAVGGWVRAGLRGWARRKPPMESFAAQFLHALAVTVGYYAPHLLSAGALAGFFAYVTPREMATPVLAVAAWGLPGVFALFALVRLFLDPPAPAKCFLPIREDAARSLAKRLKLLVWVLFLGYLALATLFAHSLPEPMQLVARGVFGFAFVVNLIWAVWLLRHVFVSNAGLVLRVIIIVGLLMALGAEAAGYRNLAEALLQALVGTLAAIGGVLIVHRLIRDFFDGLNTGDRRWQKSIRLATGVARGHRVPGTSWLRFILVAVVWLAFIYVVLDLWGLSDAVMQKLRTFALEGFSVGSLRITPTRVALAVGVFAVLLIASGWFRSRLDSDWLRRTRMDRGTRESLATVSGYVGAALALIIALAVAGFQFTNLAIIAGALSVGIGFGLQNIVNNFVSGLILLFERPIRTGDWIVVGTTQGYVRRIRMRATQIETFDRADVIIPNSDLVSNEVTNWMLHDRVGRITLPVPVAYGTDTEQVRRLLLEVAYHHEVVVSDGSAPLPQVLFRGFGDWALNFELRCHIQEVDMQLAVASDLNFAIHEAFRREGVTIPYPQRDLHIKTWPPGAGNVSQEPTPPDSST